MKLLWVKIKGVTSYRQAVELDLTRLRAGTVAVIGRNGAGKTTLLECLAPAPIYRKFPTRPGTLADWSTGKDAFLEVGIAMNGSTYAIRHLIDAEKGESEAYVTKDGQPLVSGKAREFEALMAAVFGPMNLFLAAVFSAQNKRGSLLELEKRDRRDLFNAMLGNEYLQRIAEAATDKRKALAPEIEGVARAVEDRRAALADEPFWRQKEARVEQALKVIDADLAEVETKLAGLVTEEARARAELDARATKEAELKERQAERERALDKYRALQAQRNEVAATAARLPEYEAAAKELETQRATAEAIKHELGAAEQELGELQGRRQRVADLTIEATNAHRALEQIKSEARLAHQQELATIASEITRLETNVQAIRNDLAGGQHVQAVKDARYRADTAIQAVATKEREIEAITASTSLLGEVPCEGTELQPRCKLLGAAVDARGRLGPLGDKLTELTRVLAQDQQALADAKREEERVTEELERAAAELGVVIESAKARWTALNSRHPELPPKAADLEAQIKALGVKREADLVPEAEYLRVADRVGTHRKSLQILEATIADLANKDRLLPEAQAAARRVTELGVEMVDNIEAGKAIKAKIEALEAELATTAEHHQRLAQIVKDRAAWEVARRTFQESRSTALQEAGAAKAKLAELATLAPKLAELEWALAALAEDVAQWSILEAAFGREGIQALEIDAAGPEVSRLVNDLLSACYGDRFAVAIVTTEPKADGKGTKEVFDIKILDAEQAREGKIEGLSGGEKVIVNEAIGLGLAIYNARKNPQHFATIFRDETSGALDTENARRYVTMLQRARQLGAIEHVFFITHQPELVELADHVIEVKRGSLELDGAVLAAPEVAAAAIAEPKAKRTRKAKAEASA